MYTLTEVVSKRDRKAFLMLPVRLYKDVKEWIRPLDQSIENVFDPQKNAAFRDGVCIRWILKNERKQVIGRVAAFIDYGSANHNEQPTGGLGFFECENDQLAANMLFDACKNWLMSKGMQAMDGPVNFGERNSWWGLLVEGYEIEPTFEMYYHFPYYKQLFEAYGFQNYINQYTYHRYIDTGGLAPVIYRKAERIFQDPSYTFEHIRKKNIDKYIEDFKAVYNQTWTGFTGNKTMTTEIVRGMFETMKPIMDERLIWFAYHTGRPVALFVNIPDLNQAVKHLNGKFGKWAQLKLMYHLKIRRSVKKIIGVIFGVIPEYHGRGLEGGLVLKFAREAAYRKSCPYTEMELNWIGDFNPVMMKMVERIGGRMYKTHVTYRFLFDRSKPLVRPAKVNMTLPGRTAGQPDAGTDQTPSDAAGTDKVPKTPADTAEPARPTPPVETAETTEEAAE